MINRKLQSGQSPLGTITRLAITVLIVSVLIVLGYRYLPQIRSYIPSLSQPCSSPLTYRVDSVDPRFKISPDKFKQAISEAAQIWDKAAGKQLFAYQNDGAMPISLVYDSRQEATDKLKKLNLNLDSTQASYNQLKAVYLQQKSQLEIDKQEYDVLQTQYNSEKQAYETKVQQVNSRGGANPQEYKQLNAERDNLNSRVSTLNQKGDEINNEIANINALVENLNRIGKELNLDVSAYNSTGGNLGEFEEGVYTTDSTGKKIVVYEFNDYQSLVRVLAHELGHSLGMEHVNDPQAIMYKLNQSKNMKPTNDDIAELKKMCRLQ